MRRHDVNATTLFADDQTEKICSLGTVLHRDKKNPRGVPASNVVWQAMSNYNYSLPYMLDTSTSQTSG